MKTVFCGPYLFIYFSVFIKETTVTLYTFRFRNKCDPDAVLFSEILDIRVLAREDHKHLRNVNLYLTRKKKNKKKIKRTLTRGMS